MRMYHPIIHNKQNDIRLYYYQGNLCLHTYLLFFSAQQNNHRSFHHVMVNPQSQLKDIILIKHVYFFQ